ncbi:MAG: hypothetical protein PHV32_07305 [Eubacteriales bacterium]|nr:hypothetical protein [Eubacteriales bacterium]
MKKIRYINASSQVTTFQESKGILIFSPEDLIGLLSQIPELQDLKMGFKESSDGSLLLSVGDTEFSYM